jgi:hypothetical protein
LITMEAQSIIIVEIIIDDERILSKISINTI